MASRVLVAEDEPLIALTLADLLEAEGQAVTLVVGCVGALRAARRIGIGALDVLVTDRPRHVRLPRLASPALPANHGGPRPF
jgi:CheY-like chemotaxis protein